jgi:hypothetical protein
MWFIIRTVIGTAVLVAVVYGTCFVPLGDKTMLSHLQDVWNTPVVQKKLENAKDGVQRAVEKKLAEASEKTVRKAMHEDVAKHEEKYTDEDRDALNSLLSEASPAEK